MCAVKKLSLVYRPRACGANNLKPNLTMCAPPSKKKKQGAMHYIMGFLSLNIQIGFGTMHVPIIYLLTGQLASARPAPELKRWGLIFDPPPSPPLPLFLSDMNETV